MAGVIATIPKFQFSANGVPMVGGTLDTYIAGTTTPATTWQDAALTIANTNPITLDARGECVLWLDPAVVYKFVLKNAPSNGGVVQWTQDNISNPAALANSLRSDLANATDPAKGAGMVGYMPTGTGAVATNLEARLRAGFLSFVGDFEGVPDGTFVPGGAASGTDNLTKINVALAACSVLKKSLHVSGHFYCSGGFIIPRDVMVFGDGTPHTPLLIEIGQATGTALFINGAAGLDCVKFEENAGHTQLKDIAVYNTNTNAIRSVLAVIGHLYPILQNVEIASLRPTTGAGLLLQSSAVAPAYSTLWGDFYSVRVQIGQLGTANEYSVATGLKLYADDTTHTPNTNCFYGGDIQGSISALDIDGAVTLSGPLGTQFFGTRFETSYVAGVTKTFADKATNVIGYGTTSVYTYPLLSIKKAFSTAFHGCYFEAAGFPATYDDGVNGVWPLLPVLSLTNAGEVRDTAFYNCNYNGCYVLDSGVRTHVSPTLNGYKYSTEIATAMVMRKNAAQSIPAYAFTNVTLQATFRGNDTYLLWDAATMKAVVRSKGTYQILAQVMFDPGWTAAGTYAQCQVLAGGDGFLGSVVAASPTATPMVTQVHGLIDLNVGDTVELQVIQTQGGAQNTSASPAATFMCISKV